jgi:uncharacterized repeat protein (TIGR01451 family)
VLGTLAAGQSRQLPVKLRAREMGSWDLRALVQAELGQEAKVELAVRVGARPALLIEVADLGDPVAVEGEATYEVRILNQSQVPATAVRVTATVPAGLVLEGADGPVPNRWEGQQVIFDPVPELAAGADLLYRVRVRGKEPGEWRFQAEVATDQLSEPLRQEEGTRVERKEEMPGEPSPPLPELLPPGNGAADPPP